MDLLSCGILCVQTLSDTQLQRRKKVMACLNADKSKYMVMCRDQNAGRIHSVRIDNSTFERVEEFKYFGTTLTNQNPIQEEIKSRLRSGNACYYSVQNLFGF